jgi:hypothetical protein
MGSVTPPAKLSGGGLEEDIATHRTVDEQEIGHRDLLGPKVVEGVGLVNPSVLSQMACCGSATSESRRCRDTCRVNVQSLFHNSQSFGESAISNSIFERCVTLADP